MAPRTHRGGPNQGKYACTWCAVATCSEAVLLLPPLQSSKSRHSDLITSLVNIYGSRELFVSEYRAMLADRLLGLADFDIERWDSATCSWVGGGTWWLTRVCACTCCSPYRSDAHTLDLLKARFGEALLSDCGVMVGGSVGCLPACLVHVVTMSCCVVGP